MMLDGSRQAGARLPRGCVFALMEVLDPEQKTRSAIIPDVHWISRRCCSLLPLMDGSIPEPAGPQEIIELPGYTGEEKLHIGAQVLIPKQATERLKVGDNWSSRMKAPGNHPQLYARTVCAPGTRNRTITR